METIWTNHFEAMRAASGRKHHWALPTPILRAETCALAETSSVDVYRSGVSTVTDLRGFMMARVPVGVTAVQVACSKGVVSKSALSASVRALAGRYLDEGGKLFVDSGAVGAFRKDIQLDFDAEVFPVYRDLLARTCQPGNLLLVMPDVLGDQDASLALQERYSTDIRAFIDAGAQVMMPIQRGRLTPSEVYDRQCDMLGTENFAVGVPSIPSSAAAMTAAELDDLMRRHPKHVHLLGVAGNAKTFGERYALIRNHSGHTLITCDACRLMAHVGHGRRLTDRSHNRAEDIALFAATDMSHDNPLIPFAVFKGCVAEEPGFLKEEDVRKIGQLLNLRPDQVDAWVLAAADGSLGEQYAQLDPDEEWLDDVLSPFLYQAFYLPKMKSLVYAAARSSEIAKLTREGVL